MNDHEYGALVQQRAEIIGAKPVPVPNFPPQISHGLPWNVARKGCGRKCPWTSFICVGVCMVGQASTSKHIVQDSLRTCPDLHP